MVISIQVERNFYFLWTKKLAQMFEEVHYQILLYSSPDALEE